eukprot:5078240-Amphidinium_carterae.1
MRKLLKEDEKRKERELLVMELRQATVVTVTTVLPIAVAVPAAHQNPTWMSTLTRRRQGASGSPLG